MDKKDYMRSLAALFMSDSSCLYVQVHMKTGLLRVRLLQDDTEHSLYFNFTDTNVSWVYVLDSKEVGAASDGLDVPPEEVHGMIMAAME